jgi:hypothetical protein
VSQLSALLSATPARSSPEAFEAPKASEQECGRVHQVNLAFVYWKQIYFKHLKIARRRFSKVQGLMALRYRCVFVD